MNESRFLLDYPEGINWLNERAMNVARGFIGKIPGMEYEDIVQTLWVFLLEKNYRDDEDSLRMCQTSMKRCLIDEQRKSINKNSGVSLCDMDDPIVQNMIDAGPTSGFTSESYGKKDPYTPYDPSMSARRQTPYDEICDSEFLPDLLDRLGNRERTYVVVKGYLSANVEIYKDEYTRLYNDLSDDERTTMKNSKRMDSDDMIFKVFLKIKTGTNSGTARAIKNNILRAVKAIRAEEGSVVSFT